MLIIFYIGHLFYSMLNSFHISKKCMNHYCLLKIDDIPKPNAGLNNIEKNTKLAGDYLPSRFKKSLNVNINSN